MRPLLSVITAVFISVALSAQSNYPIPEFSNEVYWYQKDSNKVVRLEKNTSKVDTKTKMGGMGGAENGYMIDGSSHTFLLLPFIVISRPE